MQIIWPKLYRLFILNDYYTKTMVNLTKWNHHRYTKKPGEMGGSGRATGRPSAKFESVSQRLGLISQHLKFCSGCRSPSNALYIGILPASLRRCKISLSLEYPKTPGVIKYRRDSTGFKT